MIVSSAGLGAGLASFAPTSERWLLIAVAVGTALAAFLAGHLAWRRRRS
jgi:hypothetical protein